jgi:hypothetical protein
MRLSRQRSVAWGRSVPVGGQLRFYYEFPERIL